MKLTIRRFLRGNSPEDEKPDVSNAKKPSPAELLGTLFEPKLFAQICIVPGAIVTAIYAVHNEIFWKLLSSLTLVEFGFMTLFLGLLTFFGTIYGALIWAWALFAVSKRARTWLESWRIVAVSSGFWVFMIFLAFIDGKLNMDIGRLEVVVYFLVVGLIEVGILALFLGDPMKLAELRLCAMVAPFSFLFFIPLWSQVSSLTFELTGIRSTPGEKIAVDAAGLSVLSNSADFASVHLCASMVRYAHAPLWYVPNLVVVWRGILPNIILGDRDDRYQNVSLSPDHVHVFQSRKNSAANAWSGAPGCPPNSNRKT